MLAISDGIPAIDMIKIRAFFDGCCEAINPGGHMGIGAIVYLNEEPIFEHAGYVPASPNNTNNVAEYMGFTEIIEFLIEQLTENKFSKGLQIDIRGDSNLVVNQMNGLWKIKSGYYTTYAREAKTRWEGLKLICKDHRIPLTLQWVPREQNNKADELSKKKMIENKVEFRIQPQEK
jgi:ribonuclease HI